MGTFLVLISIPTLCSYVAVTAMLAAMESNNISRENRTLVKITFQTQHAHTKANEDT